MKHLLPIAIGGVILAVVIYLFLKKSQGAAAPGQTMLPGQAIPVGQPCKLPDNSQGVVGPNGQCAVQSSVAAVTSGLTSLLQAGMPVYAAAK